MSRTVKHTRKRYVTGGVSRKQLREEERIYVRRAVGDVKDLNEDELEEWVNTPTKCGRLIVKE